MTVAVLSTGDRPNAQCQTLPSYHQDEFLLPEDGQPLFCSYGPGRGGGGGGEGRCFYRNATNCRASFSYDKIRYLGESSLTFLGENIQADLGNVGLSEKVSRLRYSLAFAGLK